MGVVAGRFFCYGNELGFSCRYVSVSGFHGVLAGFLVAVKQIMPDQEVSVLFKLHAKWLPSVMVVLALVTSLFLNQPMHYVLFIVFGTYGA